MNIHAHGTGITVLELMVTLAVMAILLAVAVPSYDSFINRQRMKAAVAGLHHDLMAARSQAVYRNAIMVACPGHPASGCSGASDWSNGWIVFEDFDGDRRRSESERLLRHSRPPAAIKVHAPASRPALRFFPDGSTPGSNANIGLCGNDGPEGARKLVVSNIGRVRRDTFPGIDPALCPS